MEKLYASYRVWSAKKASSKDGVIVGSDQTQEWIFPWWWDHYRRFNSHPVAFIDFGLTPAMREWCQARGTLIRLLVADIFVAREPKYGDYCLECRNAWFKKPLACLLSPFQRSIWIDLDCEIRCSLDPLFAFCEHPSGFSIALENAVPKPHLYNSGVFIFKHGIPLIEQWADAAFECNHAFRGDQDILSDLIRKQRLQIRELDPSYNWSRCNKPLSNAKILHWHDRGGKTVIWHQLMRANLDVLRC